MPTIHRQRNRKKLPILILVFLLCVQTIGYASHGLAMKMPVQSEAAEQSLPPCHDMPGMQMTMHDLASHEHRLPAMPCCDDGKCSDADCMMPAGIHFPVALQSFFIPFSGDTFIANTLGVDSINTSPPMRPPIS